MTGVRVFHEDGTWSYREESAEPLVRMTLDQYEAALATARREARAQALEEAAREIGDLRIRALIAKPDARP